jgi:(p)ppGpp synthase/HD superfamily hydrolase
MNAPRPDAVELPDASSSQPWQQAVAFAARAHRHQIRKDGKTPYVSHVFRVTLTLTQLFGVTDPRTLAAALLHDTIEDTTTDYGILEERFGPDVADMVAALTKNMALPDARREAEYDARLLAADWRVKLIKLADVYDNACDWSPGSGIAEHDIRDKCTRALSLVAIERTTMPLVDRAARIVEAVASGPLPVMPAGAR